MVEFKISKKKLGSKMRNAKKQGTIDSRIQYYKEKGENQGSEGPGEVGTIILGEGKHK